MPKLVPKYHVSGIWGHIARMGDESNVWGKNSTNGGGFSCGGGD